ncbi:MAG: hypothetical protein U0V75_02805 [Ferruginibacter sp.]
MQLVEISLSGHTCPKPFVNGWPKYQKELASLKRQKLGHEQMLMISLQVRKKTPQ